MYIPLIRSSKFDLRPVRRDFSLIENEKPEIRAFMVVYLGSANERILSTLALKLDWYVSVLS